MKPVLSKAAYAEALAEVEQLWGRARRGTPQGDLLDVLAALIGAYELGHYPIDSPDPIEALRFRIEQQG